MTTNIVGFKPPDETFSKMLAIWEACDAANITMPIEVDRYFARAKPNKAGVSVNLDQHPAVEFSITGVEVNLELLDPDIKVLRFRVSW